MSGSLIWLAADDPVEVLVVSHVLEKVVPAALAGGATSTNPNATMRPAVMAAMTTRARARQG